MRLRRRQVEPDLRETLAARTHREERPVGRVGAHETVVAVVARLLDGSDVPPEAVAAFIDERYDQPLGYGSEQRGTLPRPSLIPAGFAVLDRGSRDASGGPFSSLAPEAQDAVLAAAEAGRLDGPDGFDSALWFSRVRDLALLAFASDPRGMVQMRYPGPSYRPGHMWLGAAEVAQRERGAPGYLTL